MVAQTNHQLRKYAAENKLTRWFVYEWGKPTRQKPYRVILRSPLLRIPYYHNKRLQVKESQYLIPTYSWTLTPIPNWTCSVVTISHFQCIAPSTWLTNRCADPSTRLNHQLEKDVGYKVLQFINMMKITKLFGYKTLGCTNAAASSRERWARTYVFGSQYACEKLLHWGASTVMALKTILIYV